MKVVGIVGSAVRSGRTRAAVSHAVEAARASIPDLATDVVDLSESQVGILDGRKPEQYEDDTVQVLERIAAGTAFVIGSPTYRGTYTGALKNLLDHIPLSVLEGRPIGLVGTGATAHHYLMIDHEMRAVLAWFNAYVLPGSVYCENSDFTDGMLTSPETRLHLEQLGKAVLDVARGLDGLVPEPACLTRQLWS